MQEKLIRHLESFISDNRKQLFDKVLEKRTRYITILLEDIYQSHNVSAVLRSCDCFGIQDVHIVEQKNTYKVNREIALGADKWLTIHRYNRYEDKLRNAIKSLKENGYRIVAATPHGNQVDLEEFDIKAGKIALCFGTELSGISQNLSEEADEFLKIPMHGFTESLNISVSAAIILHYLTLNLYRSGINWQLNENEKNQIKLTWLKRSIKKSNLIEETFLADILNHQKLNNSSQ